MKTLARNRDALNVMGGQQPVHSVLIRLAHDCANDLGGTWHMAYCQSDIPGSASESDVSGRSLDEGIPALASLEHGYCWVIVRENVDKLTRDKRSPDVDCPQSI